MYGQFGSIWKLDSQGIACKTYISIKNNFLSYKNWKQTQNVFNKALILLLLVKVLFLKKYANFSNKKKKKLTSAILREA